VGTGERREAGPKRVAAVADEERRLEIRVAHYWRLTPEAFRALPDAEQDEMTAYVIEVCPDCGQLRSICSDPNVAQYPQRRMCWPSAVQALTLRRLVKKHGHPDGVEELHPLDGMSVYVSSEDLTPDDDFV
jgi:hypothetical protein